MTVALLLELFRLVSHDELFQSPRSDKVLVLIRQLPADSETYDRIAADAFRTLLTERDEPDVMAFQRLVDILTILLYHDGRTFTACLRIAELSNHRPAFGSYGINALGALVNYMRRGRPLPLPKSELLVKFEMLEDNEDLTHNAGECRKMLLKAYR
jgi:hypothetical protein